MENFKKGDKFRIKIYLGNTGIYFISKIHKNGTFELKNYFTQQKYGDFTKNELKADFIKL